MVELGRYSRLGFILKTALFYRKTGSGYEFKLLLVCHSPRSKIREKQLCRERERKGDRERKRDEWAFLA